MPPGWLLRDSVPLLGYTCLLGGRVYARKNEGLPVSKTDFVVFFAGLAIWRYTGLADSIQVDEAPRIESHGRRLGGGFGGWRVSTSLVHLAGAVA